MSGDGKNHFLLSWKIKDLLSVGDEVEFKEEMKFEAEDLGDRKWKLELSLKTNTSRTKYLGLSLQLDDCDENLPGEMIALNYQYKLLSPNGEILVISDVLYNTFGRGTVISPYELIYWEKLKDMASYWSENSFTLMCYIKQNGPPVMSSETQVADCEIETIYSFQLQTYQWRSQIPNCKHWSIKRRMPIKTPLDITLRYVDEKIHMEILSNIKDDWEYNIACILLLVNKTGTVIVKETDKIFTFDKNNKIWSYPCAITKNNLEKAECFKDKKIILKFTFINVSSSLISYLKNETTQEMKYYIESTDADSLSCLQQDFCSLLADKHFADVKLRIGNEIFFAHKVILAARSPVFLAMFHNDMAESNTGCVDVPDAESKDLKSFLEFIYTGSIKEIDEEKAFNMLIMADKYQVLSLKMKSSKVLISVLSVHNACRILEIADMVNCENLKSSAVEYIVKHPEDILSSSEWTEWAKNNIGLATEVFLKLSKEFKNMV